MSRTPGLAPRTMLGAMGLNEWDLRVLLDRANALCDDRSPVRETLAGRIVAIAEVAGRRAGRSAIETAAEVAARRLGAHAVNVALPDGLDDAASRLAALGPDLVLLSHPHAGMIGRIAARLDRPVVGLRDGAREELAGALGAAVAIRRALGSVEGRHVALLGDPLRSGLARSCLIVLGALGARLRLVAPSALMPPGAEAMGAALHTDADEGLRGVEAIIELPLDPRAIGTLTAGEAEHERHYGTASGLAAERAVMARVVRAHEAASVPVLMALMLTAMGI